jgi:hypothetical protein
LELLQGKTKTITTTYTLSPTGLITVPSTTLKEEKFRILEKKFEVDNWEIIVNEVKRTDYIIIKETFDPTYGTLYEPKKENYDFFIVNISIKNIGKKSQYIPSLWDCSIITIEDYIYERKYSTDLESIKYGKIDELSKKYPQVPIINELPSYEELDPEEKCSGWIIFTLPKDKIVKEITFKIYGEIIHIKL